MATAISTLISTARLHLNETTASFWTDAELLTHATDGIKDLWKAIIDLHQGHFLTIDDTNVSLAANSNVLTGIPADVFRVELIEVRDLTSTNTVQNMTFEARPINHADISAARGVGAVSPSGQTIYFTVFNAGSPVGTPSIEVAPQISAAVNLRLVYTPTIGTLTTASNNPIPGESDHAIVCWTVAHARAKETEGSKPDGEWLSLYATDKTRLLTALTPRQTQDPQVAEALFTSYW